MSPGPAELTVAVPDFLQDPLGWELWAMAELNAAVSINWNRLAAFNLTPSWAAGPLPTEQAIAAFHTKHGYGAPSRLVQLVVSTVLKGCPLCSITQNSFRVPPVLHPWAGRCRVDAARAELFVITGLTEKGTTNIIISIGPFP